jgi:hypothetical protein
MAAFMVRDATKDAVYYDAAIEHREADLRTSAARLEAGEFAPNAGYYVIQEGNLWELAVLRYSRGDALDALREPLEAATVALGNHLTWARLRTSRAVMRLLENHRAKAPPPAIKEVVLATEVDLSPEDLAEAVSLGIVGKQARIPKTAPVYLPKFVKSDHDRYRRALSYLSFARLVGLGPAPSERLTRTLTTPGVERLLDRLSASLTPGWPVPPKAKVGRPELYGPLVEVLEGGRDEATRARLLAEYVEGWLPRMRGVGFGPHMLRDLNYVGYWCFEAAAVAVVSQTPDAAFRDHPRYPRDLADTGRLARGSV